MFEKKLYKFCLAPRGLVWRGLNGNCLYNTLLMSTVFEAGSALFHKISQIF